MTLDQLRIFLAVAEREHVTRAAEALHLTPSATSAAISALEQRHGVRLFDRIGRRIVLSDAGRSFRTEARKLLAQAEQAERMLEDLAGLTRGHLRIAASQTVANYWLPPVLARYRQSYPGIELQLRIGNSEEAAQKVHELEADLAVIEDRCHDDLLEVHPLASDHMKLVRAAGVASLPFDPATQSWVLREPGSGTRAIFDHWLAAQGLAAGDLPPVLELPSNEAVRAAVEAGAGASILSELVVAHSLESGRLSVLEATLPQRPFSLLRHRERPFTRAEAAFLALAKAAGG
ncbi:LysR substrate-binding domain-containing protein [Thioclava litoralis]|uniref:LysR substrate-binding domain-containing protein n=1 Tax=Thioclava litoralis TaxID=3076557 RepID=A0ABZ1DY93_9RHOB|nr:LysR substrate-binding domain-containing protein [Thioclava sp. FTW29]